MVFEEFPHPIPPQNKDDCTYQVYRRVSRSFHWSSHIHDRFRCKQDDMLQNRMENYHTDSENERKRKKA